MKPKASDVPTEQTLPAIANSIATAPTDRRSIDTTLKSKPLRVTGKLATACKRIIELGEELDVAAEVSGLTTRALRLAIERPHVIAWMKAEREVFRAYVCAQNIHHAKNLRNNSGNGMVRLGAIKTLEQMGEGAQPGGVGIAQRAGMVIVVVNGANGGATSEQSLNSPMRTLKSLDNTDESTPFGGESR